MQFINEPHDLPKYLPIDSPVSCSTLQWPILLLLLISVYKSAKIAGTQKTTQPCPRFWPINRAASSVSAYVERNI